MTVGKVQEIPSPTRFHEALRRLAGAQKGTAGVPAYLRFVNRRLGGYLAAIAYAARLSPSQVTALSALCSIVGLALAATQGPTIPMSVAIAALMALGYALDSADGQLARIRGGGSKAGEWLDHVVDAPKTAALHLVILINIARFQDLDPHSLYLLVPMAFLLTSITLYFAMMLRDQLIRGSNGQALRKQSPQSTVVVSLALLPVDYGTLCLLFLFLPFRTLFLTTYAVLFGITLLFAARALAKAYRTVAAARPGP